MADEQIDPVVKQKIVGVLTVLFPHAKIYLFGSRAWGTACPTSDIDVAIDEGQRIAIGRIGEARGMFEGSNIHVKVDVVDFNVLPADWRADIEREGIIWKS
jgi:uncharacterized protein